MYSGEVSPQNTNMQPSYARSGKTEPIENERMQQMWTTLKVAIGGLLVRGFRTFKYMLEQECIIFFKRESFSTRYLFMKIAQSQEEMQSSIFLEGAKICIQGIEGFRKRELDMYSLLIMYGLDCTLLQINGGKELKQFLHFQGNIKKSKILQSISVDCYSQQQLIQTCNIESDLNISRDIEQQKKLKQIVFSYIDTFGSKTKTAFYDNLTKISLILLNTVNMLIFQETRSTCKPGQNTPAYSQVESANWTIFKEGGLKPDRKDIIFSGSAKILIIDIAFNCNLYGYLDESYLHEVEEMLTEYSQAYAEAKVKHQEQVSIQLPNQTGQIFQLRTIKPVKSWFKKKEGVIYILHNIQKSMNYLSESTIISKISRKILEPKQTTYSQQPIYSLLCYKDDYEHVDSAVYNKYNQRLKVSLFFNRNQSKSKCVVYMHGYGSNRLQGIFLLQFLPPDISLCCFDFSAEGRSEGNIVTFGLKEKQDIRAVLGYLRTCGYNKFALWGRSMGATCTLLFSIKEKPEDVFLQILDSPFISFSNAALQLTKKKLNIPELLVKLVLQAVNTNLSSKQYNPFEIDLNKPIDCPVPTIFMYSQQDEVIDAENSKKIITNFRGYYEKIVIKQAHNVMRGKDTIKNLVSLINKYFVRKKQVVKQNYKQSFRVIEQSIKPKRQLLKRNSLDSYGIWVASRSHNVNEISSSQTAISHLSRSQILLGKRPQSSIKYRQIYHLTQEASPLIKELNKGNRTHRSSSKPKIGITHHFSQQLEM